MCDLGRLGMSGGGAPIDAGRVGHSERSASMPLLRSNEMNHLAGEDREIRGPP